ncbi:MAG TPA: M48 family metalloprotease [Pyrinomonadaceae bacterium]|nr:M48 family metalloprotease [Pyrinomonadaceae bacterium]
MHSRIQLHLFVALLLGSILAYSVAAQPQTCLPPVALPAPTEPNIFSEEQEIYLGDAIAEHIQKNYHVIEDVEVTAYLTRIGERLTKHLPLNRLHFQFFLVDLPDANAFVLPGGRIFVSRKLVSAAQTEDELASVMAHELGHLVAHQSGIDTTRLFKEVLGVVKVGDRRDIFDKYNQLIENLRRKPEAFKPHDREKGQLSADQAGLFALVSAGYDVSAMARFWDRITETKGKKGSWFSDLFGSTRPEERRFREMTKAAEAVPANCKQAMTATQAADFKQWQAVVISYTGLGRKESLHGVLSKQQLSPPLRSDIIHIRFSPDGKYVLAQDDSGINVLSREPFTPLFRIETFDETYYANFSPDSQNVILYSENLRVERWSVAEQKSLDVKEVVIRKGCLQTKLSPDGTLLACLDPEFDLTLINVASGEPVWKKKEFYSPDYLHAFFLYFQLSMRKADSSDFNLGLLNMAFSPDGHYFVAGYRGRASARSRYIDDVAEALDLTTIAKVSLSDSVKKLIAGGFTFMGPERIAGINEGNAKKSAVVTFPSGDVVTELELWRKGMAAATRGDYLFIRPIKDYPLGVMDINTKTIVKVNQRAAMDIFEDLFVAEMRNGEVGLYRVAKNELVATTLLPNVTLGRLRVAELSSDMKWLALSGRSRGGIWSLNRSEPALFLRGFLGGHLTEDGYLFAEFPKYDEAERNVAKINLSSGEVTPGPKIEAPGARQIGQYLFTIKSAKPPAKEDEQVDYRKNVIIELTDARTTTLLWSRTYPNEAPRAWVSPRSGTVALVWNVKDDSAKTEIRRDPRLSQQLGSMKEEEGDYFLQILEARDGSELGKLLIETGKGSFRLSNAFAAGDWVIVTDTQNRVLIYSLKTGEQRGRIFGGYATVSPANNLLCVENETGKLALYDLTTMNKLDEFIFSSPVSMLRFSADGQKLFVLTSNQTAYVLNLARP